MDFRDGSIIGIERVFTIIVSPIMDQPRLPVPLNTNANRLKIGFTNNVLCIVVNIDTTKTILQDLTHLC